MLSKKLHINIMARVLVITIIAVLLAFFTVKGNSIRLIIIFAIALIIAVSNLISYLNKTNRNIRYFFESVRNDDSNLSFATARLTGDIKELHENMNRVNRQIQDLKIQNQQQEQLFARILEHLATGIITYDAKGFIINVNSAAKRIINIEVLTHLKQIERVDPKLFASVSAIKPGERTLVSATNPEGETQMLLKATSAGTGENQLTILSIQDIKHELDEKEVDAWIKLIRVLMHEIMNSITPITSLSESMSALYRSGKGDISPGEITGETISKTIHGLNVIKDQGKGLLAFVDSYRKLTRIPKPEMHEFSVRELFDRVKILTESETTGQPIPIAFDRKNENIIITADANLVTQVLINLIKNAAEANAGNPEAKVVITSGYGKDNCPELCVKDNGPGISRENLEHIFVPFFTTKENGSGIGLSISKQIMSAHGGSLKVRSEPGRETVFCMSFPG